MQISSLCSCACVCSCVSDDVPFYDVSMWVSIAAVRHSHTLWLLKEFREIFLDLKRLYLNWRWPSESRISPIAWMAKWTFGRDQLCESSGFSFGLFFMGFRFAYGFSMLCASVSFHFCFFSVFDAQRSLRWTNRDGESIRWNSWSNPSRMWHRRRGRVVGSRLKLRISSSRYHCELKLNNRTYARTSSRVAEKNEAVWNEIYELWYGFSSIFNCYYCEVWERKSDLIIL